MKERTYTSATFFLSCNFNPNRISKTQSSQVLDLCKRISAIINIVHRDCMTSVASSYFE